MVVVRKKEHKFKPLRKFIELQKYLVYKKDKKVSGVFATVVSSIYIY